MLESVSTLRNDVLKGAIIKGKNTLPTGCILFPLKVAPMRIENNFKGHKIENHQN